MGENTVLLKTDIRNAFNSRRRDQMLQTLFDHPELAPVWRIAHWAYSSSSSLLVFEKGKYKTTIKSSQGVKQGDVFGLISLRFIHTSAYLQCTPLRSVK